MSASFVHTCIRVRDVDRSVAFYGLLGFEHRDGRLNGLATQGIERIDGEFPTPQDPPRSSVQD
ncbi:MAG: VOC family protein [Actinomycetota bacterium]|nr:VOC family protein [Actinomycetota bacterium]